MLLCCFTFNSVIIAMSLVNVIPAYFWSTINIWITIKCFAWRPIHKFVHLLLLSLSPDTFEKKSKVLFNVLNEFWQKSMKKPFAVSLVYYLLLLLLYCYFLLLHLTATQLLSETNTATMGIRVRLYRARTRPRTRFLGRQTQS